MNIDIDQIQNIFLTNNHEALFEYVISENKIHLFIIQKKQMNVITEDLDADMWNDVSGLRKALMDDNFEGYRLLSNKLYSKLIAPSEEILNKNNIKHIIVIPDGWLHYLPLEILSRSGDQDNFATVPYLVKRFQFSYDYSANLALQFKNRKINELKVGVLAFAPEFKNISEPLLTESLMIKRDSLASLQGTKTELKNIGQLFTGNYFIGPAATESKFKKLARQFSIIHLATHAVVEDNNPEFSRLIFDEDTILDEDGKLYAYELFSLQLNAELVTLSACNTGMGKFQEGEGLMSLARGFMYAGCPSLVVSLWSVSDKSTAEVVKLFYEGLKKGMSKDEALQQAKMEYISHSDPLEANPVYWGGLVLVGNPSPLEKVPSGPWNWKIIIGIISMLIVLLLVARVIVKRRNSSNHSFL